MSSSANKTYIEAFQASAEHNRKPVGFSEYEPNAISDQILIKQNNVIIELLLKISDKIDTLSEKLIKGKQVEEFNLKEDINKLIIGIGGIDISKKTVKTYNKPKFGDGFK